MHLLNTSPANSSAFDATDGFAIDEPCITLNPHRFGDWPALLDLLRHAFAHTIGKVEPPSTVYCCSVADLALRARRENLMVAYDGEKLVGSLFLKETEEELFLGRFAICAEHRGSSLARRMIERAVILGRQRGKSRLALETRTALTENQAKFRALGFEITGGRAHAGYHGITTYRMARRLG